MKPKSLRRAKAKGFWKVGVIPACAELDRLLDKARSEFHRLDLSKMLPGQDDVTSAQVALDTAEDTMLALSFYVKRGIGRSDGEKYLRLYGFLQAIHLQQDALDRLTIVFLRSKPMHSSDSGWSHLRQLRNLTVGHPIEHTFSKMGVKRAFITRVSLRTEGFDYQVWIRESQRLAFESADMDLICLSYLQEAADTMRAILPVLARGPDYCTDS